MGTLKARFNKMVYVGDHVDTKVLESGAAVLVQGHEAVSVIVGGSMRYQACPEGPSMSIPARPIELSIEEMRGKSGRLTLPSGTLFSHAAERWGVRRLNALAAMSAIVGMIVPGLHSVFGGVDLQPIEETNWLDFSVTSVEPRFRRVRIAVNGGGWNGFIVAFGRHPPITQPTMAQIAQRAGSVKSMGKSLVVGGSRGLGEVIAKVVATGGGEVTVTYATGKADAEAVAAEISEAGGRCTVVHYDVRKQPPNLNAERVYYCPTPVIYRRKSGIFDASRFSEFNDFYIHGMLKLLEALPKPISCFVPSTVFIDSRPDDMTEYAMSKAAVEVLCADLNRGGVSIISRRLPRVATDQTASILELEHADIVDVAISIVRDMHAL